ncbi:MAG: hypothetical protein ABS58_15535 [Mesorhizobium sp. SCN 65-20]|nr:MAG: hypothetical protein ABS58_15535 [Mesorhizobium sp. SCN 65-20]
MLCLPALIVDIPTASAHQASTGWPYPLACCHDGDCATIPGRAVTEGHGGWNIDLLPGDHPRVTHRNRYFVPYGSEIPSQDREFHICLHPTEEQENCFFVPPGST